MQTILLLLSCFQLLVTPTPQPSIDVQYVLDTEQSSIRWKATYLLGGGHEGTIGLESGKAFVAPTGALTRGEVTVDMNTISVLDLEDEQGRSDLKAHLESEDFFHTKRFPRSFFSITSVKGTGTGKVDVSGFLSIKGIIHHLTLPVEVTKTDHSEDRLLVKARFTIDRTKWGVTYQSKSLFSEVKDGIISDEIELSLHLEFKR